MGKRAAIHNLGCKVNAYEAEAMQELLQKAGYEIVPFGEVADVYVINTCTVTNIADRKSRQMLHRAKKLNPDAIVVAAGCYTETDTKGLLSDGTVDILLGNNRKRAITEALKEYESTHEKTAVFGNINREKAFEPLSIEKFSGNEKPSGNERLSGEKPDSRVRSFIKVQDGCNQFCTYCIIPYARGRVRSRALPDVKAEIEGLAAKGCQEIVLTGIHLSSYGTDLSEGENLLTLIRTVADTPGIERIRLGSLEPGIITEDFLTGLSGIEKLCPHFHLSLQSGCDRTLERMNRRYRTEEFREKASLLRQAFHDPALTTDIIVGFPMETEEDFEESYRFVDSIGFYETHVFPYSRRAGTVADRMPGQIPEPIKKERSERMLALTEKHSQEYEQRHIGTPLSILWEEESLINGHPCLIGHSREYIRAAYPLAQENEPSLPTVNQITKIIPKQFIAPHILLC